MDRNAGLYIQRDQLWRMAERKGNETPDWSSRPLCVQRNLDQNQRHFSPVKFSLLEIISLNIIFKMFI